VLSRQRLARVAIRQGDFGEAERQLVTADSAAHAQGIEDMRNGIVYDRGRLALARGDATGAARLFTAFLRRTDSTDQLIRYTVRSRLAQAWAAAATDRRRELSKPDAPALARGARCRRALPVRYAATALGEYDPQAPPRASSPRPPAATRRGCVHPGREAAGATLADRLTQPTRCARLPASRAAHWTGRHGGGSPGSCPTTRPPSRVHRRQRGRADDAVVVTAPASRRGSAEADSRRDRSSATRRCSSGESADALARAGTAALGPAAELVPAG
jgi:hypothetical protein